ncbi:hypothetical protein G9A89_016729 [Geosiphon pyriformis]|nr:hypothetical protein G9A89_016729 [Geosiphon pyriformis]
MEEANHTKFTNSQRKLKAILQTNNNSSNNHKDINHHNDATKTILDYHPTTNLKIVIIVEFQDTGNEIVGNYKETNKTGVINPYQTPPTQQYQVPARRLVQHNQFTFQNQLQNNHNRINLNNQLVPQNSDQQRPNHYHTQPNEVAVLRSKPFNHTIPLAQIAQNANLSDIFPFEFEANESPFLLSNAAVNEQKAITVMYTEATVEGKPICLILDSRSAGSIITYKLMQQLKQNKTPVGEIDDFSFSIDGITIPVKVLIMDAPQYQALVGNDWLLKTNANLNWKTQELKISYQGQYTIVPAICGTFNKRSKKAPVFEFEEEKEMPLTEIYMALESTSNWAEETKQEIFEESRGWKKVRYSTPEPQKQPPYIPLKCKDCNKKLLSMGACISPEEEYETRTCYFCKAYHRERFGSPKRNRKWDNTPCLTCGEVLPEECNWIDVAMRRGVCDQTCQYALSISEKVRRETPFDAVYNSALNKLYHYPHDAEMIFDLAMALINKATQENVRQMKEAEYIEYTMELAGFDYEDEVETYHQIASHTYPTKEAQIQ